MGFSVANDSGLHHQIQHLHRGCPGFGHQIAVIRGQCKQGGVQWGVVELQITHATVCQPLRGAFGANATLTRRYLDLGFTFASLSTDMDLIAGAARAAIAEVEDD